MQLDSARLEAEINPQGLSTNYHFEYGKEDCSSPGSACVKTPILSAGSGSIAVEVHADVSGLVPGATYHFLAIANSTGGKDTSPDTAFRTYALPSVFPACPNDDFRTSPPQPSAALPDCRAYEQASPSQKDGLDAKGRVAFIKASEDGSRVSYLAMGAMPGGVGAQDLATYLATRSGGRWSAQGLLPPETLGEEAFTLGWTPDFTQVFESAAKLGGAGGATLVSRASGDGSLKQILGYGKGLGLVKPAYAGASADGSEALFESTDKLDGVPAAVQGKPNLYLWDRNGSQILLAGVMNDGTAPPQGAFAGPYDWIATPRSEPATGKGGSAAGYYTQDEHAISKGGEYVYFTEAGSGQLYVRHNPTRPQSTLDGAGKCTKPQDACTLHVSATHKENGLGPNGSDAAGTRPAAFVQASTGGKTALFTSNEKLTNNANTGPEAPPASIAQANLDGTAKNLNLLLAKANGVAVDASHIYWADPEDGTIGRADLNGEHPDPEFISKGEIEVGGIASPQYVAVDAGHIYWTNATDGAKETGTIGIAELNGDNPDPDFILGATNPQGIAVDGTYLYWSNAANAGEEDATRTIGRAKKADGSEADQAFVQVDVGSLKFTPQGIAVNASHIYVAVESSQQNNYLFRYDIGGDPNPERKAFFDAAGIEARGIALDASQVYWSRKGGDSIGCINLELEEASANRECVKEAGHPLGLTADASHLLWAANQGAPPNPGNDLYRYDAQSGALEDLTPDSGADLAGADVVGVLGASADASTVYFAANGKEVGGAVAPAAGDCEGTAVTLIEFSGQCNLYLARQGQPVAFVARLDADGGITGDATDWLPREAGAQQQQTARASADGETLLFASKEQLSAYENKGTAELYRYREGQGIGCVSCDPTAQAPQGEPDFGRITLSALTPSSEPALVLSRNLSADGNRVFFQSTDRLAGADVNGEGGCPITGTGLGAYLVCIDVYEWEAQGTGSCEQDEQGGGCIYLLSTGNSGDASFFADASASGGDAFLITRSALVRQDGDRLYDVYDAHLGGGLASQNEVPVICESLNGCRPEGPPPPSFESPPTADFVGSANPRPKRGHAKKKHRGRHHHRAGHHNRRAGR